MCPLSCYSLVHLAHTQTHSDSLRKHIIQLDSEADKRYAPSIERASFHLFSLYHHFISRSICSCARFRFLLSSSLIADRSSSLVSSITLFLKTRRMSEGASSCISR